VLPFQNMSGDPEQEYFAYGVAEDIITAISKLRWFFVIARADRSPHWVKFKNRQHPAFSRVMDQFG
jgi:TolB-like protein